MAKHIVKCFFCGENFDANQEEYTRPNARRYAHKRCAEIAEGDKTQEEKDKQELEEYIKILFSIDDITPKIRKQIDTFRLINNYTYSGMRKTLKYFFEVKGNSIEKANGGIGIVPYAYEQANMYWYAIWEAQQRNEKIDMAQYVLPTREIHIESPKRQPMRHVRRLFTFLEDE